MAHFLRGKQAGVQRDFSAGLESGIFAIDEVSRYGINSQLSTLAYDPVQSLLAVGTNETQFGSGQIYVFGQGRVSVILPLPRKGSVKTLQFCADKLICVDSKNNINVFSLETTRIIASYAPPGLVTACLTDPVLDYVLIGLQTGDVVAYDLDRQALTPFKIPCIWRERNPRASRLLPVLSLALHPRDIGSLLIGYSEGACIYSFQQGKVVKHFQYELPPGARGGDLDAVSSRGPRYPKLTHAIWHPTGTFILTAHEDTSLVFWDPKDGRKIHARTLQETGIDHPDMSPATIGSSRGIYTVKEPIFRIAWCAKEDPNQTGILVAGGLPSASPEKGLTFFELGHTPNYATTSWQLLGEYFEKPKKQHILPTPSSSAVVDFCVLPRRSPHYAGCQDPIAVIALLGSGETVTLTFPSGHIISPTNQFHVSLNFVHPFVNSLRLASIDRTRWLGLVESRMQGPPIVKGGAEQKRSVKGFAHQNVIQTAHADGTLRVWDAGHGDEIENSTVLQVDVSRALGREIDLDIETMSMSDVTGELSVGMRTGEVLMFRWGRKRALGDESRPRRPAASFGLEDISDQVEPTLKEGFLPLSLLDQHQGRVTAIKNSEVGFVCAGFESGSIAVVDLRGPAIIYNAGLHDFTHHQNKRGSFRRSNSQTSGTKPEWPTIIEFGVLCLEGEAYSSIALFVGTNLGRLVTFKLLPEPSGGYSVKLAGVCMLDDRIVSISPINSETGEPASATQSVVSGLPRGLMVEGVVLVVTVTGARIFKPAMAKGAQKNWDEYLCDAATVVRYQAHGYALLGLFGDGCAKVFSIPGLKLIASANVSRILDVRKFDQALLSPTGDIFGWTGPSEIAMLNVWGTGQDLTRSHDKLFNVEALIPPRPTITNLQWISGTQHITASDMDGLIGGPNRPPSKRMVEQLRAEEQQKRLAARTTSAGTASTSRAAENQEGYWAYMQRQVQERTENLGLMGDSMEKLEDNSAGFADDVGKFINKQKRKAVMGVISSKIGL